MHISWHPAPCQLQGAARLCCRLCTTITNSHHLRFTLDTNKKRINRNVVVVRPAAADNCCRPGYPMSGCCATLTLNKHFLLLGKQRHRKSSWSVYCIARQQDRQSLIIPVCYAPSQTPAQQVCKRINQPMHCHPAAAIGDDLHNMLAFTAAIIMTKEQCKLCDFSDHRDFESVHCIVMQPWGCGALLSFNTP